MISSLAAIAKLVLFFSSIIIAVPFQALILVFTNDKGAYVIPQLWHRFVCALFGIKVQIEGMPAAGRQTLFACNHLSYLDIPAISTVLPVSFIAKADVAGWPLFGLLAKLQRTAFISRRPQDARRESAAIGKRLQQGDSLVLFPEGTSSNGANVLPFKSSLFALLLQDGHIANHLGGPAAGHNALLNGGQGTGQIGGHTLVQPVTVRLDAVNGAPVTTDAQRDIYCWHGDMTLPPHLWTLCKNKGASLTISFHDPIDTALYEDRKKLALDCQKEVAKSIGSR